MVLFLTFIPIIVLTVLDIISIIKRKKKNIIIYSIIIGIWLILLSIILIDSYYHKNIYNDHREIKKESGIDVKSCTLVDKYLDYGGFPMDGQSLITLDCSNVKKDIKNQMKKYTKLPFDNEVYGLVNGNEVTRKLLNIKEGYYYFIDRGSEEFEDYKVHYKYTIILFDSEKNIFYYYTMDL